jgi:mRNA interferase MazF
MTTVARKYPSRVDVVFRNQAGQVALDQIRTLDKSRLLKQLGAFTPKEAELAASTLVEMFL